MREDLARRDAHSRLAVRTEKWLRHAGDRTAQHGPYLGEVARTLTNLGIVQWQLGEFEASRVTLQRALAIFEAVYGLEMGNSSEVVQRDYSHLFRARAVPKGAFRDPRSNDAARRGFGADARDRGDCSTLVALEFARGERIDPEAVIAEARADATSC